MLHQIRTIRSIGQFNDITAGPALKRLTLIYADNGSGKTTLSAILRSLGTGDALPICRRARLGAADPPEVVLDDGGEPLIFRDDRWSRTLPGIVIFDDHFIEENVCTGLAVSSENRQHLHELILGVEGVTLAREFNEIAADISELNKELLSRSKAVPESARGPFTMEVFCALPPRANLEQALHEAERKVEALSMAEKVLAAPRFPEIALPALNLQAIETLLGKGLPGLEADAVAGVQAHCRRLGEDGEGWVAAGMAKLDATDDASCPFCGQSVTGSSLVDQYRAYFHHAYHDLKREVATCLRDFTAAFSGDALAAFGQTAQQVMNLQQFWGKLCALPEMALDTAAISEAWRSMRDAVLALLQAKAQAPLEEMSLDEGTRSTIDRYIVLRQSVSNLDRKLREANPSIDGVKANASAGNDAGASRELALLKATQARYLPEYADLCDEYLELKRAKENAEKRKAELRRKLDAHRDAVFPACQKRMNNYLARFDAGFRVADVKPVQPGGRPSTSYCLAINDRKVPLDTRTAADPSFKSALSAGDRNTLALAFFFASLNLDKDLSDRIVVIDDPVYALDEARESQTADIIRHLPAHAAQVIVLSHNPAFLRRIWETVDKEQTVALQIKRAPEGSTFDLWQV
ncbi:MAG: AAA family ATPase [Armatimonadota bacterium]